MRRPPTPTANSSPAAPALGAFTPAGIAADPFGLLYAADPAAGRVVRMWGDGTLLGTLGGPTNIGGSPLSSAAVAVAPASGQLLVADAGHNRILVYARDGTPLARWGAGGGSGTAGGGATGFNRPARWR